MKRGEGRIMLSYARLDASRVRELYDRLQQAGFQPWMDERDIPGGVEWRGAIEHAVRNCDVFIACVSKHSVDRPGILRGEINEALDAWQERLDREGTLVPLRLEEVAPPERLAHLQWVDLWKPDGWTRLLEVVRLGTRTSRRRRRRKVLFAAAVVLAIIVAMTLSWWLGRFDREARAFASAREQESRTTAMGLTLWRAAGEDCSKFVRAPLDSAGAGERVRLGFEATRTGYLYVFNREAGGGPWYLIYPTLKMRGGQHLIKPGTLFEMPPEDSGCATFTLEKGQGAGEDVAFLLTASPIPELPVRESDYPVDEAVFNRLRSSAAQPESRVASRSTVGDSRSGAEQEASEGARRLRYNEPVPQTILTFPDGTGLPVFGMVTLKVD